jgi:hypothetical protein
MIIDFHTHAFPDRISGSAMESLSDCSLVTPEYDGTIAGLSLAMKESGVDFSVVLGIATNEKQQRNVNDFAAEVAEFGTIEKPPKMESRIMAMFLMPKG